QSTRWRGSGRFPSLSSARPSKRSGFARICRSRMRRSSAAASPLASAAVIRHARVAAGESVLVIGCGGVGLNVVQGARLAGARTIIACDLLDNKLAYARTFGATHTINAKLGDVVKQVQALTDGLGVDAAFDAIGGEATALQALDAVAPGGRAVLVG